MKNNFKLLIVLGVLAVLISTIHFKRAVVPESAQSDSVAKTSLPVCPHVIATDSNYTVRLIDCAPDSTYPASENIYIAKTLEIVDVHSGTARDYTGEFPFSSNPDAGLYYNVLKNADNTYLFIDQGTSLVRGLSIFALTGNTRTKNIEYTGMSRLVLTTNGYLLYQDKSEKYPNAHPEIEVSAALDLHALKLADFSDRIIYAGTPMTDYTMRVTEYENSVATEAGRYIVESKEKNLGVVKTTWIDENPSPETFILPVTDLNKK